MKVAPALARLRPIAGQHGSREDPDLDQQVVAAILSRMLALRNGEVAAQGRVNWEARQGHSLVPMMKLRLAQPKNLIDLRKVTGLSGIKEDKGVITVGAIGSDRVRAGLRSSG